jgi:hypothetical protein
MRVNWDEDARQLTNYWVNQQWKNFTEHVWLISVFKPTRDVAITFSEKLCMNSPIASGASQEKRVSLRLTR